MTPVVIDASAGVELIVDSERGRALRRLLPRRRRALGPGPLLRRSAGLCFAAGISTAFSPASNPSMASTSSSLGLSGWFRFEACSPTPERSGQTSPSPMVSTSLLPPHLHASLLTCDGRLANAPTPGVPVCTPPDESSPLAGGFVLREPVTRTARGSRAHIAEYASRRRRLPPPGRRAPITSSAVADEASQQRLLLPRALTSERR